MKPRPVRGNGVRSAALWRSLPEATPEPDTAQEPEAPEPEAAESEAPQAEEAPADEAPAASSNGSSSARTVAETGASKSKGFGIAAGKKRPGHK